MHRIVVLHGGDPVNHDLADGESVIGRHPDCQIQIPSNMVSRQHAKVTKDGESVFLEDLGSGNGTFLNGQRIEDRVALSNGDRIKIGPVLARFEVDEQAGTRLNGATILGVNFANDADNPATIMDSVENVGGFGMLDVRPEVKLKAVVEIAKSLAGTVDLDAIIPKMLDTLFEIFPHADRGCVLFKDANGRMVPKAIKHRREQDDESVKVSQTILQKVLSQKKGVLSADATSDAQFAASESISNLSIRSMMCVPLLGLDTEPMGVINIDTQNPVNQFRKEDLDLLLAVAGQAALSYENARLLVSHLEKQKQDNEMRIARDVQRALLPEELPQADGYEFFASYESAQAVGGDYYDAIRLDDGKICLSFGDVAGKGVPGALIMSRMASCVQNTMDFVHDVGKAVEAINNHMCANAVEGRFVTYVLVILDTRNHEMSLVNAGHMSPIRLPYGTLEEFDEESVGLPIGVMEDYPFEVVTRKLNPGETVVLFTDGVDEAMNPEGDLYTLDRMREFISQSRHKAEEIGRALLADVRRHANGRPQNDDITIMTFGRNPE